VIPQFKVGDKVRLKAEFRHKLAYGPELTSGATQTISRISDGAGSEYASAMMQETAICAYLSRLELAPPAPALVSLGGQYKTRDGRAVRIYATDAGSKEPVHGAWRQDNGEWCVTTWLPSGRYFSDDAEDYRDLVEAKTEREGWINVYEFTPYASKADADECAMDGRIACLHVTFAEQEGL
jgi:hypothetical protein